jgi:hypothetical protein
VTGKSRQRDHQPAGERQHDEETTGRTTPAGARHGPARRRPAVPPWMKQINAHRSFVLDLMCDVPCRVMLLLRSV